MSEFNPKSFFSRSSACSVFFDGSEGRGNRGIEDLRKLDNSFLVRDKFFCKTFNQVEETRKILSCDLTCEVFEGDCDNYPSSESRLDKLRKSVYYRWSRFV